MSSPTTVNAEIYANTHFTMQLTIKDAASAVIDLSTANGEGGALAGAEINYIMQKSAYDSSDHVYKELSDGIEFNTDGTDGVIDIDYVPGDTSLLDFSAGADLSYFHRLECEILNQKDVSMIGTVTLKQKPGKVVNMTLGGDLTGDSPVAATSHQLAFDLPIPTFVNS
jgi:hypothetical protein